MHDSTRYTQDSHAHILAQVEAGEATLLDVREQEEWDATHLKQADWVPLSALADVQTREAAMQRIPKDRPVYCHCYRGIRSMQCAQFLNQFGYDIRPMIDDYEDLAASVFDEVTPQV